MRTRHLPSRLSATSLVILLSACAGSSTAPQNVEQPHPSLAFFTPADAWLGKPLYEARVAEQADPERFQQAIERVRFKLESDAIHFSYIGSDDPVEPRKEWALPMGITNGSLAVLTSRCLIDYKYPLRTGEPDPRFRNLALFNVEGRSPTTVFMLSPIAGRSDLSDVRDPSVHWVFDDRFHLRGAAGDRYFNQLATGQLPRVGATLIAGDWQTNEGVDLVMLYFPLGDPQVPKVLRTDSLELSDPLAVARAAVAERLDLFQTFSFSLVTSQCMRVAESEYQHLANENKLWRGVAIVAAAAAILPLLGPLFSHAGLVGLAAKIPTIAAKQIATGLPAAAWRVLQREIGGENLSSVLWDESGHLVIGAVVDGVARGFRIAGVHRGGAKNDIADRVLATVREFVRGRAAKLLVQSTDNHDDVASLFRDDFAVDLASELLASGLAALDISDVSTLSRQPALARAALLGMERRGADDPSYRESVNRLIALLGS